MKTAYIDYSMSVIVSRALPDVRDGLKPVHRRILYDMSNELNLYSDKPHRKSARIVGDVLGKFHPHGDSSVYEAMVRMAQEWSLRYQLVDGQGNFGSVDGDGPAAMRYTEARMRKIADEVMADIDKDTVDFRPNFDETIPEPTVLPTKIPLLLVNGASGIAVGMATNMPPHNLSEVIDATCAYIDDRQVETSELLKYVKAPDFPTGGIIYGYEGVREAYETGRGRIVMRAKTEIEHTSTGRECIVVTEIPYMVNKAEMIRKIADLINDKKIEGIAYINDESDRSGMRIVMILKHDAVASVVLNNLFKLTPMQTSFPVNNIALVDGRPMLLTLRDLIRHFVEHRHDVVVRRTRYDLAQAEKRAHILEGLLIAVDHIDEVIRIIRGSQSPDAAKIALIERFSLTEVQAAAIIDMRLRALTGLERDKLKNEYDELCKQIAYYKEVLESEPLQMKIIKDELLEIKEKYGDDRRTAIEQVEDEIDIEDLIEEETCVFTMSNAGYLKRTPASAYRSQRRGGKGVNAMTTREEDYVTTLFTSSTHDYILFFTNTGKVHRKKGYQIPEAGRTAKGTNLVNVLPVEQGEKVTAMIPIREFTDDEFLVFATRFGTVKRITLSSLNTARKAGIRALNLEEGDELISVCRTDGEQDVFLVTHEGMAIRFHESDVRCMGRDAVGVRGIRLKEGDWLVAAGVSSQGSSLLTITEQGYGKRTLLEEYSLQTRGGFGSKNYRITEKTGSVACAAVVQDKDDALMISDDGTIIRTAVRGINLYGRVTQGVHIMTVAEGGKVISLATTCDEDEEGDSSEEENAETVPEKGTEESTPV